MSPAEEIAAEFGAGELVGIDGIDLVTFSQILEMDDDDDREFSSSIAVGFFEQAEQTFEQMDKALEDENLVELSELGHFLKGSSATLGLVNVRDECEKIQRYGKHEDLAGTPVEEDEVCLKHIETAIKAAKEDFAIVSEALKKFFNVQNTQDEDA